MNSALKNAISAFLSGLIFFQLIGCSKSADIVADCRANALGYMFCEFRNNGRQEGSACFQLVLTQLRHDSPQQLTSRKICSGLIRGGDTQERDIGEAFSVDVMAFCGSEFTGGTGRWTDNCKIETKKVED
jgi:hypothetical protein